MGSEICGSSPSPSLTQHSSLHQGPESPNEVGGVRPSTPPLAPIWTGHPLKVNRLSGAFHKRGEQSWEEAFPVGSQEQHRQRRGLGVRGQRGGWSWPLPTRDMQKGLCTCLCGRRRLLSWTLSPTQGGKEAPVLPDIWVKPGARVWGGLGLRVKGIPGQCEGFDVREAPGQRPWRVGVQKGKT